MCTETLQSYCWIIYYCMRIEVSVLRAGGGGVEVFIN